MQDYLISNPFFYSLALTLIHFVWQGFVVALVLKTALSLTPYRKPQLRYLLSSFAMLVSLALPFITFSIIHQPEVIVPTSLTNMAPLFALSSSSLPSTNAYWSTNFIEFLPYLSLLWLTVVFFLAAKLLIEVVMVNQLPKQSVMPASSELNARFLTLVAQMQLKVTPRLLISLKTQVPMAIGWLKPVILLPASMLSGLSSAQLEMLILHELAHIRRHDYLVNFLQTMISILLFFHPAVQWISKQMRNEREYCSDDIAVKHCGNAVAYAHTLADTAALCRKHRHHTIPNMAMAASGGDLKQRVVRLVNHHCTPENEAGKWLAATLIIVLVLGIASTQFLTPSLFEFGSSDLPTQQTYQTTYKTTYQQSDQQALMSAIDNNLASSGLAQHLFNSELSNKQNSEQNNKQTILLTAVKDNNVTTISPLSTDPAEEIIALLEKNDIFIQDSISKNKTPLAPEKTTKPIILAKDTNKINHANAWKKANKEKLAANKLASRKSAVSENIAQKQAPLAKDKKAKTSNAATQAASHTLVASSLVFTTNKADKLTANAAHTKAPSSVKTKQNSAIIVVPNSQKTTLASNNRKEAAFPTIANDIANNNTHNSPVMNNRTHNLYAAENNQFTPVSFEPPHNKNNIYTLASNSKTVIEHKAQLIKAVDPKYPPTAKRKGIEIEVKVNFTIDVSGRIKNLDFEHQHKVGYFRSSIKSAMQKWAFEPAQKNGKAIESQMSKIFSFSLQG